MSALDATEEFRRVAVPHLDRVYASAILLTRSPDVAADLTQETYLRALRFFHQFERGTNCRAWLMTILLNVVRTRYRVGRREGTTLDFDDPLVQAEVHEDLAACGGPEDLVVWTMLDDDVTRALRAIPEEFRNVVLLVDLQELTYGEAASAIGCPIGTVRSRLSRGRALLAERLRDYAVRNGHVRAARRR